MQRNWRNKPSQELIKIMEESVDLRLYLVHEKGPLSFTFQDEKGKKYFINIGDKINCSCIGNKKEQKEHCVHTIYVLNRIFKINFSDQLILQLQYTDAELNKMIEIRKSNKHQRNFNNTNLDDSSDIDENEYSKNKKRKKNVKMKNKYEIFYDDQDENRMNMIDDITCSICQEDMYRAEGLYYCEESCGHNFHLNCLKIWSNHKKADLDTNVTCPMCRQKWNEDTLKKQIVKNMVHKQNLKSHKGINCNNCERKNIKGERFHCLICENYNLCVECFNLNIHKNAHKNSNIENLDNAVNYDYNKTKYFSLHLMDNPLIIKKIPEENWHGFERLLQADENSCKYIIKQIKFSEYLILLLKEFDNKLLSSKNPIISNDIDNKINCIQEEVNENDESKNDQENHHQVNNISDSERLGNIHNGVNNQDQNIHNINRVGKYNEMQNFKCVICKSNRSSSLQLLKFKQFPICGDIIHVKCVEFLFKISINKSGNFRVEDNFNTCKLDGSSIFPGLSSLNFLKSNNDNINVNNIPNENQIQTSKRKSNNLTSNLNDFLVVNGVNQNNQNNFPLINMKNKVFAGRQLSNKNNILLANKISSFGEDFLENIFQVNNLGVKVTPLSTGGKSKRSLAPINNFINPLIINDLNNKNILSNKKKFLLTNQNKVLVNDRPYQTIGLAINIQKVNFDEENKINDLEKTQDKPNLVKNYNVRKTNTNITRTRTVKSGEKINANRLFSKMSNEGSCLPDLKITNNKYNNSDLLQIEENKTQEHIIQTRCENRPINNKGIKIINQNDLGIKVWFIRAYFFS